MAHAPRFPLPGSALRSVLREGYSFAALRADLRAGLVVGIVALPLSMALAIATGMPPQSGLYTAIVAGSAIALVGGSRVQVSGPTAALVAVLLPITTQYGPGGLMLASFLGGLLLLLMGFARLGRLIQFVPYPVVTGFTSGIALVIATGQLKDFLGLSGVVQHPHFHETIVDLVRHLDTLSFPDLAVGATTLLLLLAVPKWIKSIPAPLLAIGGVAVAAALLQSSFPAFDCVTIADRYSYLENGRSIPGLPPRLPAFEWHWKIRGLDGEWVGTSWAVIRALFPSAIVIAFLGAITSLLSAVASDAMSGHKHDPDAELLAQGTGNVLAAFFGGFAATGAIARTATNVRAGAVSPIAAISHAAFLLAAVLLMSPLLDAVPLASMSALLFTVAWRMADVRHLHRVLKSAPTSDVSVLLTCFTLTVVFDMAVGVTAGVVLASLLFMRRISEMTGTQLVGEGHPDLPGATPKGVMIYKIDGPLFFGAAEKAMNTLQSIHKQARTLVLDLEGVPVIDATGVVNLQSVLDRMRKGAVPVILTGIHARVRPSLNKAEIVDDGKLLFVRADLAAGVELATRIAAADSVEKHPQESARTGSS